METVLITGSSRGIGEAIARKFSNKGYNIVLNCRKDVTNIEKLYAELKTKNKNVIYQICDTSNYEQVAKMFSEIEDIFGKVDILVNNAGISYCGLFQDMKKNEIENVLNTNLNSVINCSHHAIPKMIKQKKGKIINISSIWGEVGASCEAVYSASKGAVNAFTKALGKELSPSGINVNAIACGAIQTQMLACFNQEEIENLKNEIPASRLGTPEEVANLTFFLASQESSYINASIFKIDGGFI